MAGSAETPAASVIRPAMPELDSVRGLAILMVLLYHGFAWSEGWDHLSGFPRLLVMATLPGWLGVNLFFVLSGFLITGILITQRESPDYYRNFYVRRALRIVPGCYALLLILAALRAAPWQFLVLSACYLSNVSSLFAVPLAYGPLWSLAVEEHFYLLWPAAVRRLSPWGVGMLAGSIVVLTPVLRAAAFLLGERDGLSMYTWLVADGLALGALLAVLVRSSWCTRRRLAWTCGLTIVCAAAAMAAGVPFGILSRQHLLGAALQVTPWNLTFAGFIGLTLLAGSSRWKRLTSVAPLRFLGEISYGLYLIHLLVFDGYDYLSRRWHPAVAGGHLRFGEMLIRFVCAGGVAALLAWISRRSFEQWFLRLKDRLAPQDVTWRHRTRLQVLRTQAAGGE